MEEANQKVDPSFHARIKTIEQEISELKLEIPRVSGLAEAAILDIFTKLKQAAQYAIFMG